VELVDTESKALIENELKAISGYPDLKFQK
jgi:hypothetical protein